MATQSKSVLIPFLIIAGIVFAAALAWKILGNHEEKTTLETTNIENSASVKPKPVKKTTTASKVAPTVVSNDTSLPYIDTNNETDEERKERARTNMKFAMRYQSVDKAIEALTQMRNNGNDTMAENLIRFIAVNFPNDTIPAELLD